MGRPPFVQANLCFPAHSSRQGLAVLPALGFARILLSPSFTSLKLLSATCHLTVGSHNLVGNSQGHLPAKGSSPPYSPPIHPHQVAPAPKPGVLTCSQGQLPPARLSLSGLPETCGSSWRSWRPCQRNRSLYQTCSLSGGSEKAQLKTL